MARIQIAAPSPILFTTTIPVRITDINYGGHVGNDTILSLIHEARIQFLLSLGFSELKFGNGGLIMSDVAISYKTEVFYGDEIKVHIGAADITRVSFDLVYLLEKEKDGEITELANAKTGMVCFNYETKKVVSITDEIRSRLISH